MPVRDDEASQWRCGACDSPGSWDQCRTCEFLHAEAARLLAKSLSEFSDTFSPER